MVERKTWWVLAMAVAVAAVLVTLTTRWGIGASPDSVIYIGAARNLLAGRGLTVPFGAEIDLPLTFYPPLYPALLAGLGLASADPATTARWLAVAVFAGNVVLAGLLAGRTGPEPRWKPWLAAGLAAVAPTMVTLHSMAWSEPLFLFFGFAGLLALSGWLEHRRWTALAGAGLLMGLAALTRYAGLAFAAAGVLALVWLAGGAWRARLAQGLALGAIAGGPLLLWTARNLASAGTVASRALVFHPIGLGHARQALDTVSAWLLLPLEAGTVVKLGAPLALAGGLAAAMYWQRRQPRPAATSRASAHPGTRAWPPLAGMLVIFIVVYAVFLAGSISFADANTPLDERILSPIYLAGIVLVTWVLGALVPAASPGRWGSLALLALTGVFGVVSLVKTAGLVAGAYTSGIGFNSVAWRSSPTVAWVRELPAGASLYANAPEGIYLHTNRSVLRIPRQFSAVTQQANASYPEDLAAMAERLAVGAVVVYFNTVRSSSGPTEAELVAALGLRPAAQTADGTVYALTGTP